MESIRETREESKLTRAEVKRSVLVCKATYKQHRKEGVIPLSDHKAYYQRLSKEIAESKLSGKEEEVQCPVEGVVLFQVHVPGVTVGDDELVQDLFSGCSAQESGPIDEEDDGFTDIIPPPQVTFVNYVPRYAADTAAGNRELAYMKVNRFGVRECTDVEMEDFLTSMFFYASERPKTEYSAFIGDYEGVYLYAVFCEAINKAVIVQLKDLFVRSMVEDCRNKNVKYGWYRVSSRMFVSNVVAQGSFIDVVHWSDLRLPENKFVIPDPGVSSLLLDRWRSSGDWSAMSGEDFACSMPAIAHIECNWCDVCGGVDMCRHILHDIVGHNVVDLSLWMPLAVRSVYDLLRLRENPSVVSLSSPHIRYAMARSLAMKYQDVRLIHWRAAAENLSYEFYPHRIVAQAGFAEAYAMLTASFSVLWDIFMYVPKKAGDAVQDLMRFLLQKMREFVEYGVMGVASAVTAALFNKAKDVLDGFSHLKPLFISFIKTVVRVAVGYSATSVLLEMAWDSDVVSQACELLKRFLPGALGGVGEVAQGNEDFGAIVGALGVALFVGFGKMCPNYKGMSDLLMAMIVSAAAFNRGQLWDQFKALRAWFDGEERLSRIEIFRCQFPDTVNMIECYERIVDEKQAGHSVTSMNGDLGSFYARYLKERKNFGRDTVELMSLCNPALHYIHSNDIQPVEAVRRRPGCFVFYGQSNIGKSRLVSRVADAIAYRHKANYAPDGNFSTANAIFNVNVGDDYASGYGNQDVWVFDEWFQEKDSEAKPSKSVSLLFTLVSTMPNRLNMAAVDDKGKFPRVSLVLAATNMDVSDHSIKSSVKSIHHPDALITRLKYRVKPILRAGYCVHNKRICHMTDKGPVMLGDMLIPEEELYEFKITGLGDVVIKGDLPNGNFSWGALLSLVDHEYVLTRERVGVDSQEVSQNFSRCDFDSYGNVVEEVVEGESEDKCIVSPQGISEWFSKFWKPSVSKTRFFKFASYEEFMAGAKLEEFEVEMEECYHEDAESLRAYKELSGFGSVKRNVAGPDGTVEEVSVAYCYVKPKKAYDAPTLGFGLLLVAIGAIAAIPIARKLVAKARDLKEVADVVIDGVACKWKGDSACYEPEGHIIETGGRKYFVVNTKNGYASYPQGIDNGMLELIGSMRLVQQTPVIYDSIFSIVNNKLLMGNAFALTDSRLVLPLHIARSVQKNGGVLSNGKISVTLPGQCGIVQGFHLDELGDDVAVLCLDAFKLNGVRSNVRKLSKNTPQTGLCRQVFRDALGELHTSEGAYYSHDQEVQYVSNGFEYKIDKEFVRSTSLSGFSGMCGAVYLNRSDKIKSNIDGGVVMGIHVAADETRQRRLFRVFDDVTFSLNSLLHTSYPALEGAENGLGAALGLESARSPLKGKVFTEGRLGKTDVPPCEDVMDYDVAHLLPYEDKGVECDVMLSGLKNLRDFSTREVKIPKKVEVVVNFLCEKLCREAVISTPDWIGTFSGAGVLPSITRQTAAGVPLNQLGPSKDVVCLTAKELSDLGLTDRPLPSAECIVMLDELVDRIRSGREYEAAATVSTKEEARATAKVLVGKTRLFAGAPVHEFLLQRRFFMGVLATYLKKNIAVNSALGLEPRDFRALHDYLTDGFKDPWILTADYSSMDQCFNPLFIDLVGRVVRSIAAGYPVGEEVVSDDDYVRQVLIRRLAFNRLMVGSEIIEPKGGHPSGSCLTTVFNIVADQIIFTYAFWEMLGGSLEDLDSKVRMIFLGDDSIVCADGGSVLDLKTLKRCATDCGFILTSADKTSELGWAKPYDYLRVRSEYNFLGRFFTQTEGVLDIERLSKMLQFVEERKILEVMPQAVISHRDEVARYYRTGQRDWCERVMPQLRFFGFQSIEEYLSLSIPDLQSRVLSAFAESPEKMKVTVPLYNRRKYKAQGPGDGEPSSGESHGDAEFLSAVGQNVIVNDMLQGDYLRDHMDTFNFADSDIFSRPYAVTSGNTGVTSDVMLLQMTAASSYFFHNFNAQAKLANTVFMRCKYAVKVIVATGPFVSGKLLLAFNPGPDPPATVYQASACPCTELDLASAKHAVVKYDTVLPGNWMMVESFVNPPALTTFTPGFDFGTISLWSLTPISESVVFTVYVWLEDVELRGVGFTTFALAPQGKDDYVVAGGKGKGKEKMNDKTDKFHHVSKDYKGELEMMQWKWKVENTPQWLNTTAASVETTAGCVETVEESILGPVGDFIAKAGEAVGCAALFGACAPAPNPHFEVFMQSPNWAQSQMICPVPAVRLAVVQTQKSIIPRTLFGNTGDEMNIHEYTSRMSVLSRIPWSGVDGAGTTLARWNVMPGVTAPAPVSMGTWTQNPTPLAFVAGTFRMWRGGIKYRLSVAKTAFHTGMLEVVWQMGFVNSAPSTPSQDMLSQRYIWDVTLNSTIEFEVPYVAKTPFTQIYFTPFGSYIEASDLTTGQIFLNVVNPLANSSGTVAANVDIVLYIAGGSDIEFAMPGRHLQLTGYEPGPASVKRSWGEKKKKAIRYVAQGGPFGDDGTSDGLGTTTLERLRGIPYPSHWAHLTTMGERVLSLRVIVKRFSEGVPILTDMDFNTVLTNCWFLAYISLGFTFWTGSWRAYMNITTNDFDTAPLPLTWQLVWNNTYAGPSVQAGEAHMSVAPWSNATVLEVPWYSPLAFRILSDPGVCSITGPSPATSLVEFAAGDDLAYGFQVGAPAVIYSETLPDPLY